MTSVCVVTPAGRGAVATIVVRGDLQSIDDAPPLFQAACQQPISALPIDRVAFGRWGASPGEEVVVCRTTPDRLEIHCHGGAAATARILADLRSRGSLVNADSRFEHEGRDVLDRECREAVSRATTLRTADLLLQQASGLLRREYERLAEMDRGAAARHVDELLGRARLGLHLTQPWRVVLCGRPNVGKSSLINALVGFSRSIVFDQPGTTRDVVTAETALDGWPVLLSDTAGLRDGADELESAGIARARRQIADAELRIVVVDASTHQSEDDERLVNEWPEALVVANKSDLTGPERGELLTTVLPVSALTGDGVDRLADEIVRRLVPNIPPPLTPLPITPRQVELLSEVRRLLESSSSDNLWHERVEALITG